MVERKAGMMVAALADLWVAKRVVRTAGRKAALLVDVLVDPKAASTADSWAD